MFHIAICDDEPIFAEDLAKKIYSLEVGIGESFIIDLYDDGSELCDKLAKGTEYDLIFLDIMMPKLNGIDLGNFIRETLQNNITQIVYVSSEKGYAMDLFKVRPMDFLIKPVNTDCVAEIINTAIRLTRNSKDIFTYNKRGEIYRIPMGDIYYIMSHYRKLTIHTKKELHEFYGTMEEVQKQLEPYEFVLINKSCLVNYAHIKSIKYEKVTLFNGEELPVSRNRKDELRKICNMK